MGGHQNSTFRDCLVPINNYVSSIFVINQYQVVRIELDQIFSWIFVIGIFSKTKNYKYWLFSEKIVFQTKFNSFLEIALKYLSFWKIKPRFSRTNTIFLKIFHTFFGHKKHKKLSNIEIYLPKTVVNLNHLLGLIAAAKTPPSGSLQKVSQFEHKTRLFG